MERGERSIAIAVLSVIGIVGLLATVTLFLGEPTANVAQGQSIYTTEDQAALGMDCLNRQVYFLRYEANFGVYCCPEHMIGQNECLVEKKILII